MLGIKPKRGGIVKLRDVAHKEATAPRPRRVLSRETSTQPATLGGYHEAALGLPALP